MHIKETANITYKSTVKEITFTVLNLPYLVYFLVSIFQFLLYFTSLDAPKYPLCFPINVLYIKIYLPGYTQRYMSMPESIIKNFLI
jgi:hypothetical protein